MITKDDCMTILLNLEDTGLDINPYVKKLITAKDIPLEVLQFISKHKGIDAEQFYELLRKNHNKNKSPLYTNIMQISDDTSPIEAVLTLTCLLTQICLYAKKLDKAGESFLTQVRAAELSQALANYFVDQNFAAVLKVLKAVKTDIQVLEYISGKRDMKVL